MKTKYEQFLNEELHILKGPTDAETDATFNEMSPKDALKWSIKNDLPEYFKKAIEKNIENGADINNILSDNLIINAHNNNIGIVKYLIENGVDINIKGKFTGKTALMFAAQIGSLNMVKYLVEHGADINLQDLNGDTALKIAAYYDKFEIIKYLVEHGANINTPDNTGISTALSISLKPEIRNYLLSKLKNNE
jgi:ankyrin repeat protein